MIALITGATGFVGAHIARRLAERWPQARIVAADISTPDDAALGHWSAVKARVESRVLDVTDRVAVHALIRDINPTHVVHAAAVTPSLDEERANPMRVLDVNLSGAANVIDAATSSPGLRRLVAFSSSAVYGELKTDMIDETMRPQPTGLYGMAKAAGEDVLRRFAELRGVSCAGVRAASVYGPLERPTHARSRMSHVYRLAEALRDKRALRLYGPDVQRDWVHADDVADAIAGLLASPMLKHTVYNIGGGRAETWRDTVACFEAEGLETRWVDKPDDADIALLPSDARPPLSIARLQSEFAYRPRHLRAGVATLLNPSKSVA